MLPRAKDSTQPISGIIGQGRRRASYFPVIGNFNELIHGMTSHQGVTSGQDRFQGLTDSLSDYNSSQKSSQHRNAPKNGLRRKSLLLESKNIDPNFLIKHQNFQNKAYLGAHSSELNTIQEKQGDIIDSDRRTYTNSNERSSSKKNDYLDQKHSKGLSVSVDEEQQVESIVEKSEGESHSDQSQQLLKSFQNYQPKKKLNAGELVDYQGSLINKHQMNLSHQQQ